MPREKTLLHVGDLAPEFRLPDAAGTPHALADYRRQGRKVALFFFRGTW